jgi:hypothetical protein
VAERWWERPFRVFQTNIREIDAGLDVDRVADDAVEFGANAGVTVPRLNDFEAILIGS